MEADVSQILAFAVRAEREGLLMAGRLVEAVTDATNDGAEIARITAPVNTGRLRDSITTRITGTGVSGAGVRGTIRAETPYSWYVAAGTARARPNGFMNYGRDKAEATLTAKVKLAAAKAFS